MQIEPKTDWVLSWDGTPAITFSQCGFCPSRLPLGFCRHMTQCIDKYINRETQFESLYVRSYIHIMKGDDKIRMRAPSEIFESFQINITEFRTAVLNEGLHYRLISTLQWWDLSTEPLGSITRFYIISSKIANGRGASAVQTINSLHQQSTD